MKKRMLVIMIFMILFTLSGCGRAVGLLTEQEDEFEEIGLPIEEDAAATLPIIDNEHALDERAMLEKGLVEQRDLHKLGFMTDEFPLIQMQVAYYPLEETFGYSSMYKIPDEQIYFKYEAGSSFGPNLYDNMVENLVEPKKVEHDKLDMTYGTYLDETEEDFYITAKNNALSYIMRIGNKTEGFTNKIVEQIGKTMRTEDEGVYDPFYKNFSLDPTNLQFPMINEQRAVIHDANIHIWELGQRTGVSLTYMLSDRDTMIYVIQDQEMDFLDEDDIVNEFTINGVDISEYQYDEKEQYFFHWQVNDYDYSLEVNLANEDMISTEEMQEIIESSLEDDRTIANPDVFKATNKKSNLKKPEKKLAKSLKNIHQDK